MTTEATSLKTYNRIAAIVVGGLVAVGGAWSALASLGSAVVAPATVIVPGKSKVVQHREGGTLAEIRVREGDTVRAGDLIARLVDTQPRADLGIQMQQLFTLSARMARLSAERIASSDMSVRPAPDLDFADVRLAEAIAGERALFDARRASREGQKRQLNERIAQIEEQVEGRRRQLEARKQEIAVVRREVEDLRPLRARGLVTATRFNPLERSLYSLEGEQGNMIAQIAASRAQIEEIRTQSGNIDRDHLTEVARDLKETEDKLVEAREKLVATRDRLARTEIRSPGDGVVHQLVATTIGAVAAPGEIMMQIVPGHGALALESRIDRGDVDRVYPGQPVRVRFNALDRRTTPELVGTVVRIAADAETDNRTGASYFKVEVALAAGETDKLGSVALRPGMPAETYLIAGDRTPLSYFVKPIKDQFARAFVER